MLGKHQQRSGGTEPEILLVIVGRSEESKIPPMESISRCSYDLCCRHISLRRAITLPGQHPRSSQSPTSESESLFELRYPTSALHPQSSPDVLYLLGCPRTQIISFSPPSANPRLIAAGPLPLPHPAVFQNLPSLSSRAPDEFQFCRRPSATRLNAVAIHPISGVPEPASLPIILPGTRNCAVPRKIMGC